MLTVQVKLQVKEESHDDSLSFISLTRLLLYSATERK